jgi:PKD repeat protein
MSGHHIREIFVTPTNYVYATGDPFGTQVIYRKIGPAPLIPDFEADQTFICAGTTVNFTDLSFGQNISSWSWTFEGGTPSSSTDQNPSVIYDTPGVYDVSLTITDDNGTETKTIYDYISVIETPAKPDTPDGEDEVCTGMVYQYSISEVDYADTYEWEVSPADAGTLFEGGTSASLEVDETWTGDFTLRVRASNMCGDSEWSDNLEGTVNESPALFSLEGGGTFCEGSDGVELTLDGSQTGIEYELLLDGQPTGITVDGTGSEISFGMVTEEGYYEATGTNGVCTTPMTNQVLVEMESLPTQPAVPVGPETICTEETSDYTSEGGEDADSYTWTLTPEEAGTISYDGLEATVTWNSEFTGMAYVSLHGVNDCGDGDASEELMISVGAPAPEIIGQGLVCDWSDEFYEVTENEGSNYTWEVSGGTITDGQGTYRITVAWAGEGMGTVIVEEETAEDCSGSSELFDVTIDDCTGLGDGSEESRITIYPNPAKDFLTIRNTTDVVNGEVIIYNYSGQAVVSTREIEQNLIRLDIAALKPGLYIVVINDNAQTVISSRFIKK